MLIHTIGGKMKGDPKMKKVFCMLLVSILCLGLHLSATAAEVPTDTTVVPMAEEVLAQIDLKTELSDAEKGIIGQNVSEAILQNIEFDGNEDMETSYSVKNLGQVETAEGSRGTMYSLTAVMNSKKTTSGQNNNDNVHSYMSVTWIDNFGTNNELCAVTGGWETDRTLSNRKVEYGVDGVTRTEYPSGDTFGYSDIGMKGYRISATMSVDSAGWNWNPITLTVSPGVLS